ncbi:helix-turn-helix domain-containing protein [Pseudonocardia sp.]|uniref:helix-turn-helix domain-containing protein n=1 Tax=Pseudonocardia sp. TaxID=60912 RepID=UPI00262E16DA|nr:helix-turn-helix domain-containing protein [Pseudonocardia sp.]
MSLPTLPVSRFEIREPLVPAMHPAEEVQLVVRVVLGAGADSETTTRPRPVLHASAGAPETGAVDLASVCSELARSVGSDDLAGAVAVVATVAGCPTVLLGPDRGVLAAGEPRVPGPAGGVTDVASRNWRWTANGPHADRELVISAGTHRLGVLVFHRPVPGDGLDAPVWRIVHDLLALALLGRDAIRRAAAAELQAALFACLSDEDPPLRPDAVRDQVRYRTAIVTPVSGDAGGELVTCLEHRISGEPLLAAGRSAHVGDRAVCLYPESPEAGPRVHAMAWRRVLDGLAPLRCRVVVGMPEVRGAGLRDSYRTTRWLADLQAAPAPGLCLDDVALVDELGVVAGALGSGWGPRLGHFIRRVLGNLMDNPRFGGEMVDTLHAYLVCGGSPTEAAQLLHLSPSSMKYRMRVIRETLGDRLDDHDSAFEIELALRLHKAFAAGGAVPTESAGVRSGLVTCRGDAPR